MNPALAKRIQDAHRKFNTGYTNVKQDEHVAKARTEPADRIWKWPRKGRVWHNSASARTRKEGK